MKLAFCDFWEGFQYDNNLFFHLFQELFGNVRLSNPDECDVLIYSCFGKRHTFIPSKSKGKIKIFYTGENIRPNYEECDYSFSFDFPDYGGRNIRFPLWLYQIDWYNKKDYQNPKYVIPFEEINDNKWIRTPKTEFCCGIWNNPEEKRVQTQKVFSTYKKFDLYGKTSGNWFYGEEQKLDILSKYKFSICYENAIHGGYLTEKLFHAKIAGTIPIYRADKMSHIDFNPKSFINLEDFSSIEELLDYVREVDQSEEKTLHYQQEKLFHYDDYPKDLLEQIKEQIRHLL